ncbi:ComEC/Rec2 family competence protein [Actinopolymorpha alba]|uniref:ComEC/Rec2 family competence protein n=1 Tax=Actinopolymorpha alba TaxID=533267 RepID=UPI00037F3C6C|nr:ComEC/Rec2 family competence protein [Actinopolymorpha alba]
MDRGSSEPSRDPTPPEFAPEPGPDARLVPLAATSWLFALVVPVIPPPIAVVAAVALGVLALLVLAFGGRFVRTAGVSAVAVVCLGGAVSATVATLHVVASRSGPVPSLAEQAAVATVELRITSDPRLRERRGHRPPYVVLDGDVLRITGRGETSRVTTPVVVTAPTSWARVQPGARMRAVARLAATGRGDRAAAVLAVRSPPVELERPGRLDRGASRLRAGLRAAVAGLPPNERGLVPALVVGDVSRLPEKLVDDFRTAGLSHLTAVSGTNFTILLAFVLGAARWLGVRSWGLPVLGAVCALGFVLLARPEPSVLRAAAMGLVGLAGLATGSRRHGIPALALAVIVLLQVDPWLGRTYGFALSVLATAGILVLAPRFTEPLKRWLPGFVATALAVSLAAQLACTPVVAMLSGSVSLVAVLANLVAAPAVIPATVLGIAATLVAPWSVTLASVPGHLAGYSARWIVEVGTRSADAQGASLSWSADGPDIAVLTLWCAVVAATAPWLLRRRGLTVLVAAMVTVWIIRPISTPLPLSWVTGWPPRDWTVVACDVGQGDALVIRAGPRAGVVVDTGPDPVAVDRCLSDLGIRRVPYLLLTHFHADHVSGLPGVLRGRTIGEIAVGPLDSPPGQVSLVRAWAGEAGVPVRRVGVGEQRQIGELRWTVIGPPAAGAADSPALRSDAPVEGGEEGSPENDASVVIMAEVRGVRILLTGDIEPPAQEALLRAGADLHADVLKVPHGAFTWDTLSARCCPAP